MEWEELGGVQGGESLNKTRYEKKNLLSIKKERERQNELYIRNWKFSEKLVSLSGTLFRGILNSIEM